MTAAGIVVTIGFGALVGWTLGFSLPESRPAIVALVSGALIGAAVLAFPGPAMAGGSLLLGCGVGLLTLGLRLRRARDG